MITQEDVVYAYRLLLGREPENQSVVTHYATELASVNALRELFMNSTEFRAIYESQQAPRPPKLSFNGPPMQVEWLASMEQLNQLISKVSAQWHHLGKTEPHWSVLTNDSYYQSHFEMNRQAFYASGEAELTQFFAALARTGLSQKYFTSCLELGCGVGRVTAALGKHFSTVTALDISDNHLQIAKNYTDENDIKNINFHHLTQLDQVSNLDSVDVVYSRIVLQHNPPPIMHYLLGQLLDRLTSGGVAFIQIPVYKAGYHFSIEHYLSQHNVTDMEMHFFPQHHLLELINQHNAKVIELREDDAIGISLTAISNTLLIQKN